MLPKLNRLSKKDISKLFAEGKGFRTSLVFIRTRHTQASIARFCILFTKNAKLTNVERNRIRRQAFTLIEKQLDRFEKGTDYGIMVSPTLALAKAEKRHETLQKVIETLTSHHV